MRGYSNTFAYTANTNAIFRVPIRRNLLTELKKRDSVAILKRYSWEVKFDVIFDQNETKMESIPVRVCVFDVCAWTTWRSFRTHIFTRGYKAFTTDTKVWEKAVWVSFWLTIQCVFWHFGATKVVLSVCQWCSANISHSTKLPAIVFV